MNIKNHNSNRNEQHWLCFYIFIINFSHQVPFPYHDRISAARLERQDKLKTFLHFTLRYRWNSLKVRGAWVREIIKESLFTANTLSVFDITCGIYGITKTITGSKLN